DLTLNEMRGGVRDTLVKEPMVAPRTSCAAAVTTTTGEGTRRMMERSASPSICISIRFRRRSGDSGEVAAARPPERTRYTLLLGTPYLLTACLQASFKKVPEGPTNQENTSFTLLKNVFRSPLRSSGVGTNDGDALSCSRIRASSLVTFFGVQT